jgi:hypothetical protein
VSRCMTAALRVLDSICPTYLRSLKVINECLPVDTGKPRTRLRDGGDCAPLRCWPWLWRRQSPSRPAPR